jgi:hypothetical protein
MEKDAFQRSLKGAKCSAVKDDDGEIRILYQRSSKKYVGLQLSFDEPRCAAVRSLKRKESNEFLKLKPVMITSGGRGHSKIDSIRIFSDRDPEKLRNHSSLVLG